MLATLLARIESPAPTGARVGHRVHDQTQPVTGQGRGASPQREAQRSAPSQRPLRHRPRVGGTRRWHSPRAVAWVAHNPQTGLIVGSRTCRNFSSAPREGMTRPAATRSSPVTARSGAVVSAVVRSFRSDSPGFSTVALRVPARSSKHRTCPVPRPAHRRGMLPLHGRHLTDEEADEVERRVGERHR